MYVMFLPSKPINSQESDMESLYYSDGDTLNDGDLHKYNNTDLPIIVWTTRDLFPHPGTSSKLTFAACDNDINCLSTRNSKYLEDNRTRGVIFYGTEIDPLKLPLPRKANHEWALFHEESPMNNYVLSHDSMIQLFNHTATFKRESDYPLTTQNIYSLKFLTERKPIPTSTKNKEKETKGLAPVIYVQSHCDVASDRDSYVKELMKYIKIDSYGKCLHNKDLPEHLVDPAPNFENEEFLDLISIYKFHLAFENAICDDYQTEKLIRPLHVGSVPIYYGSSKAQDWMPSNPSVIMVNEFESPQKLAEFILELDNDDEKYEEYLSFKKPNGVTNMNLINHLRDRPWGSHDYVFHIYNEDDKIDYFRGFECHICSEVTKRKKNEDANYLDSSIPLMGPKIASTSHLGCPKPFPSLGDFTESKYS